jgi:hypothetical protein
MQQSRKRQKFLAPLSHITFTMGAVIEIKISLILQLGHRMSGRNVADGWAQPCARRVVALEQQWSGKTATPALAAPMLRAFSLQGRVSGAE